MERVCWLPWTWTHRSSLKFSVRTSSVCALCSSDGREIYNAYNRISLVRFSSFSFRSDFSLSFSSWCCVGHRHCGDMIYFNAQAHPFHTRTARPTTKTVIFYSKFSFFEITLVTTFYPIELRARIERPRLWRGQSVWGERWAVCARIECGRFYRAIVMNRPHKRTNV